MGKLILLLALRIMGGIYQSQQNDPINTFANSPKFLTIESPESKIVRDLKYEPKEKDSIKIFTTYAKYLKNIRTINPHINTILKNIELTQKPVKE